MTLGSPCSSKLLYSFVIVNKANLCDLFILFYFFPFFLGCVSLCLNVWLVPLPSLWSDFWVFYLKNLCFLTQVLDNHGLTPLSFACYENHCDCVKFLLEKVGALLSALSSNASARRSTPVTPPPNPHHPQCLFVSEAVSADEVTHRTKAPLTECCGGCAGMSIEHNTALPFTCFVF